MPVAQIPPHRLIRNFLGDQASRGLLDHVLAESLVMQASTVLDYQKGGNRLDRVVRQSVTTRKLGEFDALLKSRIAETVPSVRQELGLPEFSLRMVELELAAHGDGGHYHHHVDTVHQNDSGRIMSAVYYFFREPKCFSGGELRLFGWWRGAVSGYSLPWQYITPEHDSLLVFPSWALHEVMPVVCPSDDFADSRFSVNCWVWRTLPVE